MRKKSRLAGLLLLVVGLLSGCGIVADYVVGYSLEVRNRCGGPNSWVDFYLDDEYKGQVGSSATFRHISPGHHTVRAVGTGRGGHTFRDSVTFRSDMVWVLCP